MKLLLLFLSIFINLQITLSQNDTTIIKRLIVYNNKTIEGIDTFKVHIDYVKHKNDIIYLKLQPKKNKKLTLKYSRVDSQLYNYRKYINRKLVEEGTYILDTIPLYVDTVITFDPETFYELYTIYESYKPIKNGLWLELDSLGRKVRGHYYKGLKNGYWASSENEVPNISWNYSNGKIIDSTLYKYIDPRKRPNYCCSEYIPSEIKEFSLFFPNNSIQKKKISKAIITSEVEKSNYPKIPLDTLAVYYFDKDGFVIGKASFFDKNYPNTIHYYLRDSKNRIIEYKQGSLNRDNLDFFSPDSAQVISKYYYPSKGVILEKRVTNSFLGTNLPDSLGHRTLTKYDNKGRLIESSYINYTLMAKNKIDTFSNSTKYRFDENKYLGYRSNYLNGELRYTDTVRYTTSWEISSIEWKNHTNNEVLQGSYSFYKNHNQIIRYKNSSFFNYEDYAHCPDAGNFELVYFYDKINRLNSIRYLFSNTEIIMKVEYLK